MMNQKLMDQLLHKAGARFGAEGTDYSDFTSSKFAELIINECIDQVAGTKIVGQFSGDEIVGLSESADKKYAQWNNALVIATMNVRDHFGVEE
jgi:hypothetical protein